MAKLPCLRAPYRASTRSRPTTRSVKATCGFQPGRRHSSRPADFRAFACYATIRKVACTRARRHRDRRTAFCRLARTAHALLTCRPKKPKMGHALLCLRSARRMHTHTLGRAVRFCRTALYRRGGSHSTFRQRSRIGVAGIVAALSRHGNRTRRPSGAPAPTNPSISSSTLPSPAWGHRFPVNARLSLAEIDHILATQAAWQRRLSSLRHRPFSSVAACARTRSRPLWFWGTRFFFGANNPPWRILSVSDFRAGLLSWLSSTNGTTGRPNGVVVTTSNPGRYRPHQLRLPHREGGGHLHRRRFFTSWIFHSYSRRRRSHCPITIPKFSLGNLLRPCHHGFKRTCWCRRINLLTQFAGTQARST